MRVDEGRKGSSLLAIKNKTRTVMGRGEKSLFRDPGSELYLATEKGKEKCEEMRWDEQKTKQKQKTPTHTR